MMSRIEAQEHLDAIRARGIAFGGYAADDAAQMIDGLRDKAAGIDREEASAKPAKATPELLAAMGIGVIPSPSEKAMSDV